MVFDGFSWFLLGNGGFFHGGSFHGYVELPEEMDKGTNDH